MHRFFFPSTVSPEAEILLPEAQAHQVREVLRLRAKDRIAVVDATGAEYTVELTSVTHDRVSGRVLGRIAFSREPRTRLVLYQGLLKADKFEWVLQKCTELGVSEFVPMITARSVVTSVSPTKRARWERILAEATEQSGRNKIPQLHELQGLRKAVEQAHARGGLGLMPWEEERRLDLRHALRPEMLVHLFIGPEGGFTAEEVGAAREHNVLPVSLGPRILRAETAGLVAAAAIFFERGEMDGRPGEPRD